MENTPLLQTERLLLRRFDADDTTALFQIMSDRDTNRFLPWFPFEKREQAASHLQTFYLDYYRQPAGYRYAVCLQKDNVPIGYVHVSGDDSHDLGYGIRKEFWHRGLVTEAAGAVVERLKKDGIPYITATHDVQNPRSGEVMKKLGMRYRYSYREQWQPKNIPVVFRLYQLNLDGVEDRVYRRYWEMYPHFVEEDC